MISRFRTELTEKNAYEKVFRAVNKQLEKHQIIVKTEAIIDASATDSPRKPKSKSKYDVVVDRREDEVPQEGRPNATTLIKKTKPGVDPDGRWLKKDGKLRFGFKQHTATDERGLVLGIVTTGANESDIKYLDDVLAKLDLPKKASVKADKGYKSKENDNVISKRKLRNHVMHKAAKGKPLTERELLFNKHVSKVRYQVERTFGSMKRWFGGWNGTVCRTRKNAYAALGGSDGIQPVPISWNSYAHCSIIGQNSLYEGSFGEDGARFGLFLTQKNNFSTVKSGKS